MEHVVPVSDWMVALARIVEEASDGDTVVVSSLPRVGMGERARKRLCPDKRLTFVVRESAAAGGLKL